MHVEGNGRYPPLARISDELDRELAAGDDRVVERLLVALGKIGKAEAYGHDREEWLEVAVLAARAFEKGVRTPSSEAAFALDFCGETGRAALFGLASGRGAR